jgi:hypothetical protein
VALALPVLVAVPVGILLGGTIRRIGDLRLRAAWLFFVAIALQLVAFPFGFFPWRTDETVATVLWLASYALLIAGVVVNRQISGISLVAMGMGANVLAIVANGGSMPVLPDAMRAAGDDYVAQANSTAVSDPNVSWLVDRWAAPDWIPLANVFSVGDVVIGAGAAVIVLAAMGVRLPRMAVRRRAARGL